MEDPILQKPNLVKKTIIDTKPQSIVEGLVSLGVKNDGKIGNITLKFESNLSNTYNEFNMQTLNGCKYLNMRGSQFTSVDT